MRALRETMGIFKLSLIALIKGFLLFSSEQQLPNITQYRNHFVIKLRRSWQENQQSTDLCASRWA